jgi:hypothetical protein
LVWHVCRLPVPIWAALCALLAATRALADVPLWAGKLPLSPCITAVIGAVFMRLREDTVLDRFAPSAGPVWGFIMLLLIGVDYLTR